MKKAYRVFIKAFIVWSVLSTILFVIGNIYSPHSVSSSNERVLGGIYWWSLTILNGYVLTVLQKLKLTDYTMIFFIGTLISSLIIATLITMITLIPIVSSKVDHWLLKRSKVYNIIKSFFKKIRPL